MCDHFQVETEIEMRNLTVTKQSQGLFFVGTIRLQPAESMKPGQH